jgi:cytochrome c peroxidase
MKKIIFTLAIASTAMLYSCTRSINITNNGISATPNLPSVLDNYEKAKLPNGMQVGKFIKQTNQLGFDNFGNPIKPNESATLKVTNAGATLGRVLFYDTKLSLNNTISCGSCHHQDKAFTDGQALSRGVEGRLTTRSAMAICNPIEQNNLFWDSRSNNLEDLALKPVANHIEMGMDDMDRLVTKLSATSYYAALFQNAFGDKTITKERISNGLSQFVASITTSDSKFDKNNFISNGSSPSGSLFTPIEQLGHTLFTDKCGSCHGGQNFIADDAPSGAYGGGGNNSGNLFDVAGIDKKGATNIGLDFDYKDNGTGNGNFKIPSLRNIALTAPYMHDGRFATLDQVLNHYTNGIKPHSHLDVKFKGTNSTVKMIDLSEVEKQAVIAFLQTLTDNTMIADPKYSNPFKN